VVREFAGALGRARGFRRDASGLRRFVGAGAWVRLASFFVHFGKAAGGKPLSVKHLRSCNDGFVWVRFRFGIEAGRVMRPGVGRA
jgi:hypothetical protein